MTDEEKEFFNTKIEEVYKRFRRSDEFDEGARYGLELLKEVISNEKEVKYI